MFILGTNSYHEHIGCRQDLLQWMKSGNNSKKKFAFRSNSIILLDYQKPLARGSDLKLNQGRAGSWGGGGRQLMIFRNVWKLKLTYSDKTGYVPGFILQPYLRSSSRGFRWLLFWSCLWPYISTLKQVGFFFEQVLGEYISFMEQIPLLSNGTEAESGFGWIPVQIRACRHRQEYFLGTFIIHLVSCLNNFNQPIGK